MAHRESTASHPLHPPHLMTDKLPDRFTDEHARAILARAIEIDARTPMTTTEDLRAIAAEIGVSPAALLTVGWCLRSWVASSILGSAAVIAVRRSRASEGSDTDSGTPDAVANDRSGRWTRLGRRILDRIVHRVGQAVGDWSSVSRRIKSPRRVRLRSPAAGISG